MSADLGVVWPGISGMTVVVTGAAGGQGLATANLLARAGARLVLADLDPQLQSLVDGRFAGARAIVADIGTESGWEQISSIVDELRDEHGVSLVNNAGLYRVGRVDEMSLATIEQLYRVNQLGPLLGARAIAPLIRASGRGSIVNVSSTAALAGFSDIVAYSMTKWAVRGLTRALAAELAEDGIRVNTVIPGLIDTPMASENGDEVNRGTLARTHLRRMGLPAEVVPATAFLLSEHAAYITGAELVVDGGLTA